jgi:hypothetical protein
MLTINDPNDKWVSNSDLYIKILSVHHILQGSSFKNPFILLPV